MFPPLGSLEIFLVYDSPPLFYSEFLQVGTVSGLNPDCQRLQYLLQFQFAITEVFVLVTLLLTAVIPPLFSTMLSTTQPEIMQSVEDTTFFTFPFVGKKGCVIIPIRSTFKIELQFQFGQGVVQLCGVVYVRETVLCLLLV
ncbi:MAG: hypothetical protein EZS28_005195, partial [Streblomastix strix]